MSKILNVSQENTPTIALLLVAAGTSSRLGQPKQLVEISTSAQQHQSLLQRQIALMNSVGTALNTKNYCVLGYQYEQMHQHLANTKQYNQVTNKVTLIHHENFAQGLSTSIAKGVTSLANDIDAVAIFLVDQWQLSPAQLQTLIQLWQKHPKNICIASDRNVYGPPVIFPRAYFNELMTLQGDEGAKPLIKIYRDKVLNVDMPSAFIDLDTQDQLEQLKKHNLTIAM